MTRWEYLIVDWQLDAEPFRQTWRYDLVLRVRSQDGQTTEHRHPYPLDGDPTVRLLNDLGAEGWEMVTACLTENAIAGSARRGHVPASYPTGFSWQFKRPAT